MNRENLFIVTGFIILVSLLFYYLLGGFNPVEYSVIPNSSYTIVGREYIGTNNTEELKDIFVETRDLLETDFMDATLIIVNDENHYDDENNQVGYFIGLLVENIPSVVPDGYSVKEYGPKKVVRARMESHNMVMPKPDKVRAGAAQLAASEGNNLSDLSFEKYPEEGIVEVDFLLIQ